MGAQPLRNGFGIPKKFFLGISSNKGVNFHGKFGLGIPNHNNSGSKNLEIPRNSQKFPEIPRNSKFVANRTWNS